MIKTLLVTAILAASNPVSDGVPQLREDTIPEIVAAMTPEEK